MASLKKEMLELAREVKHQKEKGEQDSVDALLQDVKEYASTRDLNPDVLYSRLVRLEETARKHNNKNRNRYHLAINRFLAQKDTLDDKALGNLVLMLLASSDEHAMLERERKLTKRLEGEEKKKAKADKHDRKDDKKEVAVKPPGDLGTQWPMYAWPPYFPGQLPPFLPPGNMPPPYMPPPFMPQRTNFRFSGSRNGRCYKCGKPGHYARSCVDK